jgi:hypothetical protein
MEAARPVDAENAPTGLCKTADGFAQLPHASPSYPFRRTTKTGTPQNHRSPTHRFCGGGPKGNQIADLDPERLVTRVTSLTANQKLESLSGQNRRNVTAAPAVLLTYEPGTKMTVVNVFVQNQYVRLDLNDAFNTGGPNTTALLVEWSKRLSREFTERPAVEELIQKFLTAE